MVHGNALNAYYGILVSKEQYKQLSEELPMKYVKLFKDVGNEGFLIFVELKGKTDVIRTSLCYVSDKRLVVYKKDLQDYLDKIPEDFIDEDILQHLIRNKKTDITDTDTDKYSTIYKKITSYKGDYYNYMGLTRMTLDDLEKYYYIDEVKLKAELECIIEPIKEQLGQLEPSFYVYAYSY